jgi:hypothetical protein
LSENDSRLSTPPPDPYFYKIDDGLKKLDFGPDVPPKRAVDEF